VRNAFVDGETGRVRGVSLDSNGDVPKITEAGLGRAMDAARLPDKSLALSPQSNDRLTATLDALRRQNIVQGVKRTATAGSGSDTVPGKDGDSQALAELLVRSLKKPAADESAGPMAALATEIRDALRDLVKATGRDGAQDGAVAKALESLAQALKVQGRSGGIDAVVAAVRSLRIEAKTEPTVQAINNMPPVQVLPMPPAPDATFEVVLHPRARDGSQRMTITRSSGTNQE
jgi:hypothetical protein